MSAATPKRLGRNALARELGCSPTTIAKHTTAGRMKLGDDGMYDVDECRRFWIDSENIRRHKARGGGRPKKLGPRPEEPAVSPASRSSDPTPKSEVARQVAEVLDSVDDGLTDGERYSRAHAAREVEMAAIAKLERRKLEGELIEKSSVERAMAELGTLLTSRLYAMPDLRADEFAGMTDGRSIYEIWEDDIDRLVVEVRRALGLQEAA